MPWGHRRGGPTAPSLRSKEPVIASISVTLGQGLNRPPEEVFDVASTADDLGYDELWIGEMAMFDAFALATAVGLRTRRISPVIGPLAVAVRTPVSIAMGVATAATAIGRPVHVALGTSSDVVVSEWHGLPRDRPAKRLGETATVVRRLLDGEKLDFDGDTLSTHGYRLRLPVPECSLSIAAFGPRAVAAAAAHADRMVLNMVTVESARRLCGDLERAAASASRPRPRVAVWLSAAVDPEPEDMDQLVGPKTGYLAAPGYGEMFAEAGFADLVEYARTRPHPRDLRAAIPDDELVAAVCIGGNRNAVAARIDAYFAAGVDEICVIPTTAGDPGGRRTLTCLADLRP